MPQLNPAPWLMILLFAWMVLVTFLPTKVMGYIYSWSPKTKSTKKQKPKSWSWPWY
nr:ATP synthase F0 subunit 8 [Schismorhynchus labialis]